IKLFPAISAYDIGDKIELAVGKIAVRAVNLAVDIAGVNKEHGIRAADSHMIIFSLLILLGRPYGIIFIIPIIILTPLGRDSSRPYRFYINFTQLFLSLLHNTS